MKDGMMLSKAYGKRTKRRAGLNIFELIFIVFVVAGGVAVAVSFWRRWGILGGVIGFPLGLFGLFYLLVGIQEAVGWWLPSEPACRCGKGAAGDYKIEVLKEDLFPGAGAILFTCEHCGRRYVHDHRKFLEVSADNTLHPYMKHAPFGRWRPDCD
jgi:hypothetical protein